MSPSEQPTNLDPAVSAAIDEAVHNLRTEIRQELLRMLEGRGAHEEEGEAARTVSEAPQPQAPAPSAPRAAIADAVDELKHAASRIDQSASQAEILDALCDEASRFASRSALLLLREDGLELWSQRGFDSAPETVRGIAVKSEARARLAEAKGVLPLGAEECATLCDSLGAGRPAVGLLLPFVIGDRVVAGLYADRVDGDGSLNLSALQLLTFVAGQVLEGLPVRSRSETPALRVADHAAATAPVPDVVPAADDVEPTVTELEPAAAMPETEVSPPPEPAAPPETAPDLSDTTDVDSELATPEADEAAADPAAGPAAAETGEPGATAISDASGFSPGFETAEIPPLSELGKPDPAKLQEPPTAEEEPEAATEGPAPEETRAEAPASVPEAEAAEPEPEAAAEEETSPREELAKGPAPSETAAFEVSSATQVKPPEDVEGPGWAFTGGLGQEGAGGDDTVHEEARRLARLLVTEIKLYNEDEVESGRRESNLYQRLQEDIDRSRQIYEDRVASEVRGDADYFKDALVRILGGGDEGVLGL